MTDTACLEAQVAALPCWTGRVELAPLPGGLSNRSFVVRDGSARYVARCGGDIPIHHVFRGREIAAAAAAHAAGLSPEVVYTAPGVMVLRYIEGRTFDEADMRANVERIARLLQACHRDVAVLLSGPVNAFWVFHVIRDYARSLSAEGGAIAERVARCVALAGVLEAAQPRLPIVFGHHDLLPGNILDDGTRLWLIDWEYAGFGTCMFDLANVAANGSYVPDDDTHLLGAYFDGNVDAELLRGFEAMKIASALREALWAMVSERHLALPGVDYRAHAATHFGRCDAARARYVERYDAALPALR